MWTVLGALAIVVATIGVGLVVERRLGPRRLKDARRARLVHAPGDAPMTAITATDPDGVVERERCRGCRGAVVRARDEHVRYDGRELRVVRLACPTCGQSRSLWLSASTAP